MRTLALLPDRDTRGGDWHGAFRPEAERFARLHGSDLVQIDVSQPDRMRRAQVRQAILTHYEESGPFDGVALFCHGWREGIQLGYKRGDVADLASVIATCAADNAVVALYACSTSAEGETDPAGGTCGGPACGGFAEALHGALRWCVSTGGASASGIVVYAHDRAGHTTSNPYVRRLVGDLSAQRWVVEPESALWGAWHQELHDREHSTLRLRYPFMTLDEIAAELRRGYGSPG